MPEELDARTEFGGVASSICANNLILKSGRSGAFSCTQSASASARLISGLNVSRSREAPAESPTCVSNGHASSTYLRRFASACGPGSDALMRQPAVKAAPPTGQLKSAAGVFRRARPRRECWAVGTLLAEPWLLERDVHTVGGQVESQPARL